MPFDSATGRYNYQCLCLIHKKIIHNHFKNQGKSLNQQVMKRFRSTTVVIVMGNSSPHSWDLKNEHLLKLLDNSSTLRDELRVRQAGLKKRIAIAERPVLQKIPSLYWIWPCFATLLPYRNSWILPLSKKGDTITVHDWFWLLNNVNTELQREKLKKTHSTIRRPQQLFCQL